MKTVSTELKNHLANNDTFTIADLYTITLVSGTILRYTSCDVSLSINGNTHKPINIVRGNLKQQTGLSVDDLSLSVFADTNDVISINNTSQQLMQLLVTGTFDGATLLLERAFYTSLPSNFIDKVILFKGYVDINKIGRLEAQLNIHAETIKFNLNVPKNLYQTECNHTIFDSGCKLVKANFAVTSSIIASTSTSVFTTGVSQATGYFDQGTIIFTSGNNSAVTRTIKSQVNGIITLNYPLTNMPVIGNTLTLYPGCNKSRTTCKNKYANMSLADGIESDNNGGFPFIPVPVSLL